MPARKGNWLTKQFDARPEYVLAGAAVGVLGLGYLLRKPLMRGVQLVASTEIAWSGGVPLGPIVLKFVGKAPNGKDVYLAEDVADKFLAMKEDAKKAGIDLVPVSGFRGMAKQTALYTAALAKAAAYGMLPGKTEPPTAKPGFSNHQSGKAVDIAVGMTLKEWRDGKRTAIYNWLESNAIKYGFKRLPSEPWHYSTDGR